LRDRIIEIGRGSVWYLSSSVLSNFIGFLSLPILTRVFTPRDFGIFSLVNTAITLITPIFFGWVVTSVIRFYPEYKSKGKLDVFYSTVFHYAPHFMLVFLAILLPIAAFVAPLGQYRVLFCLAIAVFAFYTLFNVALGLMRARQMAFQYAVLTVFIQFMRYLVGAGIAVVLSHRVSGNFSVNGPFMGWLAGLLIVTPVELVVVRFRSHFRWEKRSKDLQRQLFSFGFVLIFTTFMSEILTSADRYMLQWFKGAYQVGLYSMVYTLITNVETLMISFIMAAASPVVFKVYELEGEEKAVDLIGRMTRYMLLVLIPAMTGMYALRYPIIRVVTTAKYLPAQSAFLPVIAGAFLFNISWPPQLAFYLKKRTKLTLIPMGIAAVSNVALNLYLIPHFGFRGAAWATFAAYLIFFVIITVMAQRLVKWRVPWVAVAKIITAGAIMAAVLEGMLHLPLHGWWGLTVLILSGAVVYLAAMFLLKGFTPAELELVASIPGRLARRAGARRQDRHEHRRGR
jgi:O-antigen/teichoic acid export membrane protein